MPRKEKNKELKEAGFSANRHCYTCGVGGLGDDSHFCPGDDSHLVKRLLSNPKSAPHITKAILANADPWLPTTRQSPR